MRREVLWHWVSNDAAPGTCTSTSTRTKPRTQNNSHRSQQIQLDLPHLVSPVPSTRAPDNANPCSCETQIYTIAVHNCCSRLAQGQYSHVSSIYLVSSSPQSLTFHEIMHVLHDADMLIRHNTSLILLSKYFQSSCCLLRRGKLIYKARRS